MIDILSKIMTLFRSPSDPKAKYFESLHDLREFQRRNPEWEGPLCVLMGNESKEEKHR